ncbi:unnamed protein product [Pleuronectes platessa]|uniref:Uncharacterized protein n=1 Tax=Pleuronectes platessa TaxID=8262 RepID=A0A9N7ZBR1_PLEPL|nr:unnamed protein product [Pleuronectes platessa]
MIRHRSCTRQGGPHTTPRHLAEATLFATAEQRRADTVLTSEHPRERVLCGDYFRASADSNSTEPDAVHHRSLRLDQPTATPVPSLTPRGFPITQPQWAPVLKMVLCL